MQTKRLSGVILQLTLTATGCSINLPLSKGPIPSADPVILESRATKKPTIQTKKPLLAEIPAVTSNAFISPNPEVDRTEKQKITEARQGHLYYVVRPNDTVFEVMRKTGAHWTHIIKLNNLKGPEYRIHPGQSLRIR